MVVKATLERVSGRKLWINATLECVVTAVLEEQPPAAAEDNGADGLTLCAVTESLFIARRES